MSRFALIFWLWLPFAAFADGKIFPPTAFPESVTIPEQEALIHWTNGVERLVIETRFDAAGSNFAWVVPLPAAPKIEAATTGVFPTLRMYFAPEIGHAIHRWYLVVLMLASLVGTMATLESQKRFSSLDAILCAAFALPHAMVVRDNHAFVALCAFLLAAACISLVRAARGTRRFWCAAMGGAFGVVSLAILAVLCVVTGGQFISVARHESALFLIMFVGIPAAISAVGLVVILEVPAAWRKRVALCPVLLLLEYFFILVCLPPALGKPARVNADPVAVSEQKVVGSYETTVIQSKDPHALHDWFKANGYALPAAAEPVIADYVREGWVFVAAKLRPDPASGGKNVVHPLSFLFPAAEPVFPMRLTGVESGPVRVALHVFGAERAMADGFHVAHCERPAFSLQLNEKYPVPPSRPHGMDIQHPLLREWLGGSTAGTKLEATLDAAAMRRDVTIRWTPFKSQRTVFYSRTGAVTFALNIASVLAFVAIAVGAWKFRDKRILYWLLKVAGTSVAGFAVVYLALPKIPVRAITSPGYKAFVGVRSLHAFVSTEGSTNSPPNLPAIRERIRKTVSEDGAHFTNPLQGGAIREEDSPGNFLLRKMPDGIDMIFIDIDGGEWVVGSLPPKRD